MSDTDGIDFGPLKDLIGEWQGDQGTDIAPEPDGAQINPYFETISYKAVGVVTNAESQNLSAVHYLQVVQRKSDGAVFHHETGYWMWNPARDTVMHSLVIPRAVGVLAGGIYSGEKGADGRVIIEVAAKLGRSDYRGCIVMHSLSKRSNAPGLRSGFVAGDAKLIRAFLHYRTYHGSAMALHVQAASTAAWKDEAHVQENRRLYREKFRAVIPILEPYLDIPEPEAGFYLWPLLPFADVEFCRALIEQQNVITLPGRYLARESGHGNPGQNRARIVLTDEFDTCLEGARRIATLLQQRTA